LEFDSEGLHATTVLRANSHLTNMFKVFVVRFGEEYFRSTVSKLMDFIIGAGDLNLRGVDHCDRHKVQKLVMASVKAVMRSAPLMPVQLRHMGSVLRTFAGVRFNRRQPMFNTLSGFFYLRFLTGAMMDMSLFEGYAPPSPVVQATVLIPFAQLLQLPLNMNVYSGRYDLFEDWNHHLIKHVFPELLTVTWSLADLEEAPEYPAPDEVTVQRAVGVLLDCMVKNREAFETRYRELMAANKIAFPMSWNFAAFLMSFFTKDGPV
jgi:hypothetical protein